MIAYMHRRGPATDAGHIARTCFALLCLLAWHRAACADTVQLAWDFPPTTPVAAFRIYRAPGACAASQFLPRTQLLATAVDSQEATTPSGGSRAIDANLTTMWHTPYSPAAPPKHPHWIVLNLGQLYHIDALRHTPRPAASTGGVIVGYRVDVSQDNATWVPAVVSGTMVGPGVTTVPLPGQVGRYVRLTALSEVTGQAWTSVAELEVAVSPLITTAIKVGEVAGTQRVFTDGAVPAGTTQCWYATAVSSTGIESLHSNVAQTPTVLPASATNFRYVPVP